MAEHWVNQGHNVTLIVIYGESSGKQVQAPLGVKLSPIVSGSRRSGSPTMWFSALLKLRTTLLNSNPDVVVSLLDRTNIVTLGVSLGTKLRVIVSERTVPSRSPMGPLWFFARRVLFPRANGVVLVCHAALNELPGFLRCPVRVLPGPVRAPTNSIRSPTSKFRFISLGRLAPEKRFDLLIAAFADVIRRHPVCELHIFGEGGERARLEMQIASLGLADSVTLRGVTADSYAELNQANCYVITSEFEGYPRALAEAMLTGLPVVAFDSPGGIKDMITHDSNGLLVPFGDIDRLAAMMLRVASDTQLADRLGMAARRLSEQCTVENIMPKWDLLLRSVVSGISSSRADYQ